MRKAIVLLSGGLDSTTAAAIAQQDGFELHAMSFSYGQRHKVELERALESGRYLGVKTHIFPALPSVLFEKSSLVNRGMDVPKQATEGGQIPSTYVPARNAIFLMIAVAYAEGMGASHIYTGVNAVDYSGYPDCRPAFMDALQEAARLATKTGVEGNPIRIRSPLISYKKSEIIRIGTLIGVDYSKTHSCYDPVDGLACGQCASCRIRLEGFAEAGIPDPIAYVGGPR